jgi:type VI protein secretion system component VasK
LAIKIPTPDTEEQYLRSVNQTVDALQSEVEKLRVNDADPPALANIDLDTGNRVKLGDYPLTDQTYARLLEHLTSKPERVIPVALKQNITEFYAGIATASQRLTSQLEVLKRMKAVDGLE